MRFFKKWLHFHPYLLSYPELALITIFFVLHLFISTNKIYLLIALTLFIILKRLLNNSLVAAWYVWLSLAFFYRGIIAFDIWSISIPWYPTIDIYINHPLLFSDLFLGIATLLAMIEKNQKKTLYPHQQIYIALLVLFQLTTFFSAYYSMNFQVSLVHTLLVTRIVTISILGLYVFQNSPKTRTISLLIFIIFSCLNSFLMIGQSIKGGPLGTIVEDYITPYGRYADENLADYRPGGIYWDPNIAATISLISLPIIFELLITKKNNRFGVYISAINLIAIFLSGSRTGMLLAIFYVILNLRSQPLRLRQISQLRLIPKIALLALFLIIGYKSLFRIGSLTTAFSSGGGGTMRIEHLLAGYKMMSTNLLGVGPGSFEFELAQQYSENPFGLYPRPPHNIFVQIGGELGFIGLIVFIGIILHIAYSKRYFLKSGEATGVYYALIQFFILSNVFPWLYHIRLSHFFGLLVAATFSYQTKK